jgi:hypothetical protein
MTDQPVPNYRFTPEGNVVVTEILQATGETRERELTPQDYQTLFGQSVSTADNGEGTFTHTINPGGPPPPELGGVPPPGNQSMTPEDLAKIYREQMLGYVPMRYQQQLYGVPSGADFPSENPMPAPERMPKPNVWKMLKDWLTQPKVVNVTRTPRRHYDPVYMAAFCTPWDRRHPLTGQAPRRGGRVAGQSLSLIAMEEALASFGVPAEAIEATPSSAPALRMEMGMLQGVRIVRSMPRADEAEAKWATHVGIGEKHV